MRKKRNFWNKENCMLEAVKYLTRSEFKFNSGSAYSSARKNGFLNEICLHMIKLGNRNKRCIYSYEFSDNHVYVGLTYNIKKRMLWRNENNKDTVTKYINKTGLIPKFIQLTDFLEINQASVMEGVFLENYKNNGWTILNKAKTGSVGGNNLIWTYDKCQTEALKYKFRNEFRINSGSAYNSAQKNMWLNKICLHMNKYKRKIIWTYDKCQTEALKYTTKKEFKFNSGSAYSSARKNGFLNEICLHMHKLPYNTIYWTKEKCAYAANKCKTRTEFFQKYGGAYNRALRNNWLNEFYV
jgi:hypothetical protein